MRTTVKNQGAVRRIASVLAVPLGTGLVLSSAPAYGGVPNRSAATHSHQATFASGSVLLAFRPGTTAAQVHRSLAAAGAVAVRHEGVGAQQVRVAAGDEVRVASVLRADPAVRYAEPDYLSIPTATPNDPSLPKQWALRNTGQTVNGITGTAGADANVVPAWNVTTGSPSIVVAEVDTGVEYTHPDLAANIWTNSGSIGGCAAGTHGYNVLNASCNPMDDDTIFNGHGTHVAGIIGGVGNNGVGVSGINWHTKILPVKWIPASGPGRTSDLIAALDWVLAAQAAGVNVRIVNDSNVFLGTAFSQALIDEIDLLGQHGILFVTAAGSSGQDDDNPAARRYPCSYARANELCATWTDQRDALPTAANYGGRSVDIAAPGDNIYSTLRNGTYGYLSGGSMAAAAVSGGAALILAAKAMTVWQLKADLLEHGKVLSALTGKVRTGRRLDICAAVPGCATSLSPNYVRAFGKNTFGAYAEVVLSDRKRVNYAQLPTAGALTKLSVFLAPTGRAGTQSITGVIYNNVRGFPRTLLAKTKAITFSAGRSARWFDLPLARPLSLPGGRYWIGILAGGTSSVAKVRWSTSVRGARASNLNRYAVGPTNPFGAAALDARQVSLFATYVTQLPPPFPITAPAVGSTSAQPGHPSPEPQQGVALATGKGWWDYAPTAFAYQWSRCSSTGASCTLLPGATTAAYTPVAGDVGSTLQATVTATNALWSRTSTSVPTLVVQGAPPPSTFGKTAIGTNVDPADADWERLDTFALPHNGTVSKLTLYMDRVTAGAQSLRGLLYANNNGVPGALLGTTGDLALSPSDTSGWFDLTFPTSVPLTVGTYWIGAQFGGTTQVFGLRYDESTRASSAAAPAPFTGPPALTGWKLQAEQVSVYATYTSTP